jgi:hypothetical protein
MGSLGPSVSDEGRNHVVIYHVSLCVRDPRKVSVALADIAGATAVRAPTPPFPHGSWFVLAGDQKGSAIEVLPHTTLLDPHAPLGVRQHVRDPGLSGNHVLISSVMSRDEIKAIAEELGWIYQEVETGLFRVAKLWVDGAVLVEVLASGEADRYIEAFGSGGQSTIDAKLRSLEQEIAQAISVKLTEEEILSALGNPIDK